MTEPLAADAEIRNLLARIAHLADDGEIDEYLAQFTDDAVWEMPANPAAGAPADRRVGLADIADGVRSRRASGRQGPGTSTRHAVISIEVNLASERAASTVAYWMFFADTRSAPRLAGVGRYDDQLRFVDGRWRLARRRITVG